MKRERILLIHWKPEEAKRNLSILKAAGFDIVVDTFSPKLKQDLKSDPADTIIIDLTRLPSHGFEVGLVLRQTKYSRSIPLLFVGGDENKVNHIRSVLPDASYADWDDIVQAIKRTIALPPKDPKVPRSVFDGYSRTPLSKKLGIKSGSVLGFINEPVGFRRTLSPLPPKTIFRKTIGKTCDLGIWFVISKRELGARINRISQLSPQTKLWIAWPKKSSGKLSDLTQQVVRDAGLSHGLVDYKIASFDSTWSGLLFAKRK